MYGLSSLFPSPFSVARTGLPSLSFLHVRGPQWPAVATYISGSDLDQVPTPVTKPDFFVGANYTLPVHATREGV